MERTEIVPKDRKEEENILVDQKWSSLCLCGVENKILLLVVVVSGVGCLHK